MSHVHVRYKKQVYAVHGSYENNATPITFLQMSDEKAQPQMAVIKNVQKVNPYPMCFNAETA